MSQNVPNPLSMSSAATALTRALSSLEHFIGKAEADAQARNIDPQIFMDTRLTPDMWPLKKQIQTVCELAKNAPYRIAGQTPPDYQTAVETFEDAYALITRARADIDAVPAQDLDGQEAYEFSLKMGPRGEMTFTGISYLSGFTLPNIYFHMATAYNILRQNGVALGKLDFFGGAPE